MVALQVQVCKVRRWCDYLFNLDRAVSEYIPHARPQTISFSESFVAANCTQLLSFLNLCRTGETKISIAEILIYACEQHIICHIYQIILTREERWRIPSRRLNDLIRRLALPFRGGHK